MTKHTRLLLSSCCAVVWVAAMALAVLVHGFEFSQQRYHQYIISFSQYRCLTVGVLLA